MHLDFSSTITDVPLATPHPYIVVIASIHCTPFALIAASYHMPFNPCRL